MSSLRIKWDFEEQKISKTPKYGRTTNIYEGFPLGSEVILVDKMKLCTSQIVRNPQEKVVLPSAEIAYTALCLSFGDISSTR